MAIKQELLLSDDEIKEAIYKKKRPLGFACDVYPRDRAVAEAQIRRLITLGWRPPKNGKIRKCPQRIAIGDTRLTKAGYILVRLAPDDPYVSMANKNGMVLEHRLVMAKQIGRPLKRWELVHHKGAKTDNRPEKLMVLLSDEHDVITIKEFFNGK